MRNVICTVGIIAFYAISTLVAVLTLLSESSKSDKVGIKMEKFWELVGCAGDCYVWVAPRVFVIRNRLVIPSIFVPKETIGRGLQPDFRGIKLPSAT